MKEGKKLPTLRIGELEINPPFVQGGMGVRVSKANLAAAVAKEGCAGIISTVGLGDFEGKPRKEFIDTNNEALRQEIRKAREMAKGVIGVNVLVVLSNYEELSRTAAEESADMIIAGAGLPSDLPEITKGFGIKLVPIVSSARAFNIICRKWQRYGKRPDAVVVEGPKAGGHLGFRYEDIINGTVPELDKIVVEVVGLADSFEPRIPVIAAGGIFDGKDIARVLGCGASGVQMATRFVCTKECDVHENFKKAYLDCKKEDITIIKSPVGMPGRVISNAFVEKIKRGETAPFKCSYQCLDSCDPKTAPYCIGKVLLKAAEGDFSEAFAFCGTNAYRCKETTSIENLISVKDLISELTKETIEALK